MAKYIIREANKNDLPDIARLRHTIKNFRSFETEEYISFWNTQINNNPYSIRHVFVGVNENNQIVAHEAMVPYKFLIDGDSLLGGSLCELMVHEDFRNELVFPRLEMKILSTYKNLGMDFSFGLANRENVKQAHLSFGYSEIGDLVVYAKPYKLACISRHLVRNNIINTVMMPGIYIADKLLHLKRRLNRPCLETAELSVFDQEIDSFLVDVQKHFPYSSVRSASVLNWRFTGAAATKYHILVVRRRGEIAGYAVLRRSVLKGLDVLAVVDVMFYPDQADAGKSLMHAVDKKAVELGVEMSACLLNPYDPLCQTIKKCGYFRTPETFALIIHEPKGITPRFSKDSFAKWHLTWFDHDAL